MKRHVVVGTVLLVVGFAAGRLWQRPPVIAQGQGAGTPSGNGDVNADGTLNLTDAIYVLQYLFQGGSAPLPLDAKAAGLPATGQTKCYNNAKMEIPCDSADFPGQDGFYQAGCPVERRFVDNGDGTVTDNCTGLMWQQDTADVNGNGSIGDEDRFDWQGALKYCDGLDLAGHTDWRLPNVRELQSLLDYGRFQPAIDPVFEAVSDGVYWSSSFSAISPDYFWYIDFEYGVSRTFSGHVLDDELRVRAVRNAP